MVNFWSRFKSDTNDTHKADVISLNTIDKLYDESMSYNHKPYAKGYPIDTFDLLADEIVSNPEFLSNISSKQVEKLMNLIAYQDKPYMYESLENIPQATKELAYANIVSDINQAYDFSIYSHIAASSTNFETVAAAIETSHAYGVRMAKFTSNPNLSADMLFSCMSEDYVEELPLIVAHKNVSPMEALNCFDMLTSYSIDENDAKNIEKELVESFLEKTQFNVDDAKILCSYNNGKLVDVVMEAAKDSLLTRSMDAKYAQKRFNDAGYSVDFDNNTLIRPNGNDNVNFRVVLGSPMYKYDPDTDSSIRDGRHSSLVTDPDEFPNKDAIWPLLDSVAVSYHNQNIHTLIDNLEIKYSNALPNDTQLDLSDLEDNDTIGYFRP